jgi:hypothetical protein
VNVVKVMNGAAGRSARVLAGLALIGAGLAIGGTGGAVLAIIGAVHCWLGWPGYAPPSSCSELHTSTIHGSQNRLDTHGHQPDSMVS